MIGFIGLFLILFTVVPVEVRAADDLLPAVSPIKTVTPQLAPAEHAEKTLPGGMATKDQADQYYKQCVGNMMALPSLNPFQRDYLCSCVSAGIRVSMGADDMRALAQPGTPAGQKSLHRFLNDVYLPCATEPINTNTWSECLTRTRGNGSFSGTAVPRCQCYLTQMNGFMQKLGIAEAEFRIAQGKVFVEPYDVLVGTPGFSEARTKNYMACFDGLIP